METEHQQALGEFQAREQAKRDALRPFVGKRVRVQARREHNPRMGLHGRDGFCVIFPDGLEIWLPTETFELAFGPCDYWSQVPARPTSTPLQVTAPDPLFERLHAGHVMYSSRTRGW
jgi:hypothetical protein